MKPQLEKGTVTRKTTAELNLNLSSDFDRYSSGSILMTATHADHKTGKFRGIVCSCCNRCIGQAKENPKTLRRAAAYIERNTKKRTRTKVPLTLN